MVLKVAKLGGTQKSGYGKKNRRETYLREKEERQRIALPEGEVLNNV